MIQQCFVSLLSRCPHPYTSLAYVRTEQVYSQGSHDLIATMEALGGQVWAEIKGEWRRKYNLIADLRVPSGKNMNGATWKLGTSLCRSEEPSSSITYLSHPPSASHNKTTISSKYTVPALAVCIFL